MLRHYPLNPATGLEDPTQLPWSNGVPSTGTEGSYPPYGLCTDPQEEIINAITTAGIAPGIDLFQLTRAVRSGTLEYYLDSGTTNHVVVAPSLPHLSLFDGLHLRVNMLHAPSGASDLQLSALATKPIKRRGNVATIGNEWAAGDIVDFCYSATANAWFIVGLSASDVGSGILGLQVILTSGTYTPTTGARKALAFATGAGGSGAGSGGSQPNGGGGGGGGTALVLLSLMGIASVACTIGLGGTAIATGAGTPGNNGGSTSFGSYTVATGGTGGQCNNTQNPHGAGGIGTTGLLLMQGNTGEVGTGGNQSGLGGGSFWGGGGSAADLTSPTLLASPGTLGGGGGGGCANSAGGGSGAGGNGVIVILEF